MDDILYNITAPHKENVVLRKLSPKGSWGEKGRQLSAYLRLLALPLKSIMLTFVSLANAWRQTKKTNFKSLLSVARNFIIYSFVNVVGKITWEIYAFRTRKAGAFQENLLRKILRDNSKTEYGRQCNFGNIKTVRNFQKNVPVITYNDMMPYIDRMSVGEEQLLCHSKPVIYTTTSGTTAKPKYLPVTETSVKKGHKLTQQLWLHHLCRNYPSYLGGKALLIVSPPVEGHLPDGTPYGSATGLISKKIPKILKEKYALPSFIAEIKDYTAKYYCILRLAMDTDDITYLTTANPSTIALLCQKMQEWAPALIEDISAGTLRTDINIEDSYRQQILKRVKPNRRRAQELSALLEKYGELTPQHVWPRLKTIGCWTGGNAGTFLNSLTRYFSPDINIHDIGYLASELKGSIPIKKKNSAGMLALADNFFEFVEVEQWNNSSDWKSARFLMAHELEVGKKYYIFITNNNGLYRYDINDIVQVTGFHNTTPEIIFLQKGKGVTNITGEKLYESQVVSAVEQAKKELKLDLYFYMCVANAGESRYELLAEFGRPCAKEQMDSFIRIVDNKLQEINVEYATKRSSLRLSEIRLRQISKGGFDHYKSLKIKEGQREGQFKMVILSKDLNLLEQFSFLDCGQSSNVVSLKKTSAAKKRPGTINQVRETINPKKELSAAQSMSV